MTTVNKSFKYYAKDFNYDENTKMYNSHYEVVLDSNDNRIVAEYVSYDEALEFMKNDKYVGDTAYFPDSVDVYASLYNTNQICYFDNNLHHYVKVTMDEGFELDDYLNLFLPDYKSDDNDHIYTETIYIDGTRNMEEIFEREYTTITCYSE